MQTPALQQFFYGFPREIRFGRRTNTDFRDVVGSIVFLQIDSDVGNNHRTSNVEVPIRDVWVGSGYDEPPLTLFSKAFVFEEWTALIDQGTE